jgi:predicted amidohydrolase
MTPFSIAGVQMHVSASSSNIEEMRRQLAALTQRFPWVDMVVFSELAALGPRREHAQDVDGPARAAFCEMAREHGIWLIPGSIFEQEGGRIYNTSMAIDPTGEVVGRYRKMFPFEPYEQGITPGREFLVFDVPRVGRFGLSICYDMWFPETTRTMAAMGAEVILHPSLTDTIDRNVEVTIAQASAAMNQCFIVDVNGVGEGGHGHSSVVGPQGNVVYRAGPNPEVIPVQLDLEQVRWERENGILGLGQVLKSFRDRQVDFPVYRPETFDSSYLESLGALRQASRNTPTAAGRGCPSNGLHGEGRVQH